MCKKETPNSETKASLDEYEEMKNNPKKYKRYSCFSEALDDVFGKASPSSER